MGHWDLRKHIGGVKQVNYFWFLIFEFERSG
jgi:hypothetical protein